MFFHQLFVHIISSCPYLFTGLYSETHRLMFSSIPLSVSRLIAAFLKIRAAHQFCDFKFNLKFAMTATALYIGQRIHKKSNRKDRVSVPSIPTT